MDPGALTRLTEIAGRALERDLARLAALRAEAAVEAARLATIAETRRVEAEGLAGADPATLLAAARWAEWATRARDAARARLDGLEAEIEAARAGAAESLGRKRAVETLTRRAEDEARAARRRAAERAGAPEDE